MNRHHAELTADELRWSCDTACIEFDSTEQVRPVTEVLGQDAAREALLFGIQCGAPGQNVFVRGQRGTGRVTMVRRLLQELSLTTDHKQDRCYVHNFQRPDHPRLISLAAGTASAFRRRVNDLAEFIQEGLIKTLEAEPYASRRQAIREALQKKLKGITQPLEQELAEKGMALVSIKQGPMAHTVIFPLVDGQPMPPDQLRGLVTEGKAPAEQLERFEKESPGYQQRLYEVGRDVGRASREGANEIQSFNSEAARDLLADLTEQIVEDFAGEGIREFIDEILQDAVGDRLSADGEQVDLTEVYGVNIVVEHADAKTRPVIEESTPSLINLLGTVEPSWPDKNRAVSDYRGIRGGALLNADNGFLILDVDDLLAEPGAYRALMRTLRTGRLEIVPREVGWLQPHVVILPQAIEINVRVILIGDMATYYKLDLIDPDFRELFKVLADFDSELQRCETGVKQYASVVAQLAKDESLPPFHKSAIGALAEHGARIASRKGKLTAQFGRIADIAREAAFLTTSQRQSTVVDQHVIRAVDRTKQRASLPSRKFQELVEAGTILLQTSDRVVGQVNGLAVMRSGPLTYGFPARITATIGPGRAGLINIEGHAQMSGSIHTKGFYILGGLLRHLLNTPHPLAFSASLAFEQSYGGIDGDSASGAEMVCLLSALTGIPIKQSMSMTGAIDQHGHIEAIGGVNEKIEGFYDACSHFGLTGEQGTVIPQANVGDLMLRRDVVDAVRAGQFHVYAVDNIHDAIELLTGIEAGRSVDGVYPAGTVLHRAVERAAEFWKRTLSSPERLTTTVPDETPATLPLPEFPLAQDVDPDDERST